jgi:DNA-binding ferritin-like protein (Dps family)
MKQILIQRVGDVYLSVDMSGVGRKAQSLPSQQHKSWQEVEQYLLSEGAPQDQVKRAGKNLENTINAILTF